MSKHNQLRGTQTPSTVGTEPTPKAKEPLDLVKKTGKTKGKGSKQVEWQELNHVPESIDEFNKVTGTSSMAELCEYLFAGYNEKNYSEAADEIGEFVDDSWSWITKDQFRAAVRGMAKLFAGSKTIEEIAAMMKPGADASDAANRAMEAQVEKDRAERAAKKAAKESNEKK